MLYYVESRTLDPYENLAAEEFLFNSLQEGSRCLMLWQNRDTVVIGKYQNAAQEINAPYVREQGILVARRLSGGGAVFHDLGNLNYTLIEDRNPEQEIDFSPYLTPVLHALQSLGLEASFSGRNDILVDGRKVSGCAQYEREGRILHHGCILVDTDLEKLEMALKPPAAKFISRSTKSVRSRVASLQSLAGAPVSIQDLKRRLREAFFAQTGRTEPVRTIVFDQKARDQIRRLRNEKYAAPDWIYGYEADFQVRKQRKFPSCLLMADMDVEKGRISRIRLTGDFFGSRDIRELEKDLTGLALQPDLAGRLSALDIGSYIHGLTGQELTLLLLE